MAARRPAEANSGPRRIFGTGTPRGDGLGKEDMTRRGFLVQIGRWLTVAAAYTMTCGHPPLPGIGRVSADEGGRSYVPLDGRNLRELVARGAHRCGGRFVNPFSTGRHGGLRRLLQWKLFSENRFRRFYAEEPTARVRPDWETVRSSRGLSVTFIKHSCVLIKEGDQVALVDPVFGKIMPFIKDFSPLGFEIREMPRPNLVLVTHGHYDHLDIDSLKSLGSGRQAVSPLGYRDLLCGNGFRRQAQLDWFEEFRWQDWRVTLLPCNHWTMRNPFAGPNTALWGSFLVRTPGGAVLFIAGDTAYFDGFEQIGAESDIDLAVFNLGAYEPRWFMAGSHMNPAETVQAFRELGARRLMIVHWGTFRLGDEPVHFPPLDLRRELQRQGLLDRLVDLSHGQTVDLS